MFKTFVDSTIDQVTMSAALRRTNTYSRGATDLDRRRFREGLCEQLALLLPHYRRNVPERKHLVHIKTLQQYSRLNHAHTLKGGKLRLGIAQKALNLYLKLHWALKHIARPPHCPLDYRIIRKLPRHHYCRWTALNHMASYKRLIGQVRELARQSRKSIAEWELKEFQT